MIAMYDKYNFMLRQSDDFVPAIPISVSVYQISFFLSHMISNQIAPITSVISCLNCPATRSAVSCTS